MSEHAPVLDPDAISPRPLPSWPWLTMLLNLALIATIFLTRERWAAWKLEKTYDGGPSCTGLRVRKAGRRIVTSDGEGPPWIADLETGKTLWWLRPCSTHAVLHDVESVIIRPHIARVSGTPPDKPRPLWVLDVETGKKRFELSVGDMQARDARFSVDGKLIVAEHEDGVTRVWDAFTGEIVPEDAGAVARTGDANASGPRAWHAVNRAPGYVWIAEPGKEPRAISLEQPYPMEVWQIDTAKLLGGGSRILAWEYDGYHVRIWDAGTGELLAEFAGRACDVVGERLWMCRVEPAALLEYRRVRPEWWWGVFWLPHFWLIAGLGGCVFASGWRDNRRMRRRERENS